jgi:hypothetical protein
MVIIFPPRESRRGRQGDTAHVSLGESQNLPIKLGDAHFLVLPRLVSCG